MVVLDLELWGCDHGVLRPAVHCSGGAVLLVDAQAGLHEA